MLDEEDLALIGEANPEWERKTTTQVSSTVRSIMNVLTADVAQAQAPKAWTSRGG